MGFVKVWWTGGNLRTAGLVFREDDPRLQDETVLRRVWPVFEWQKLIVCHRSPVFATELEAIMFKCAPWAATVVNEILEHRRKTPAMAGPEYDRWYAEQIEDVLINFDRSTNV